MAALRWRGGGGRAATGDAAAARRRDGDGPGGSYGVRVAAMRVKVVMSSCSPRAEGSTPAARRVCSAACAEPAHPARAERRDLRRWAKAASTTAKVASRKAPSAGGGRRVKDTRAESTLGTGQKTARGTGPARRT